MATFLKIKLNKDNGSEQWRLILTSKEDIEKYCGIESKQDMRTFIDDFEITKGEVKTKPAADITTRSNTMQRLFDAHKFRNHIPMVTLVNLHGQKTEGMKRLLVTGSEVCVNQGGGYCDLDGFLSTWDGKVIDEQQKDSFIFPND